MNRAHGPTSFPTPAGAPRPAPSELKLRERYEQYRRRQAARLVSLVPRDAVRPLYRQARARALRRGSFDPKDPAQALVELCLELLPLPPFERWREDVERNPLPHVEDEAWGRNAHPAPRATRADTRVLTYRGVLWYASLHLYPDHHGWRGFIAFHSPQRPEPLRTADIFHEINAAQVRDRFRSFEDETLKAFLRSVLP